MKISRLLGIVTLLLNRERMTAGELARHFEVSVRTILRDLEALDEAGIPVQTVQGQGGGVGIMQGFALDRQFLSVAEISSIVTALEGLSRLISEPGIDTAREKLGNLVSPVVRERIQGRERVLDIDMAPWYGPSRLGETLNLLLEAAQALQVVSFCYSSTKGECSEREVEPYKLSCKGNVWYLYGYCLLRNDFRMFRLSRIRRLERQRKTFTRREVPEHLYDWDYDWEQGDPGHALMDVVLKFNSCLRYRVEDFFADEQICEQPDGSLLVRASFPRDEWVYSYVLGCGPDVEVVEPEELRECIMQKARAVMERYRHQGA
ncbi:MAG: YafY family transcriptional regulator [Spirochaetales bacterium]|nr:YafY family transcriptional regulator [Spirochaetales bacterium]